MNHSTPPDLRASATFLKVLFGDWPNRDTDGRRLFVNVRHKGEGASTAGNIFLPLEELRAVGWIPTLPATLSDENVWVGVHPRWELPNPKRAGRLNVRGDNAHVLAADWLYADLDREGAGMDSNGMLRSPLPPGVPLPTMLVASSPNKRQIYWKLRTPMTDLNRVATLVNGLAIALGGDKVGDAARILRLPGFRNQKYPERPLVKLLWVL